MRVYAKSLGVAGSPALKLIMLTAKDHCLEHDRQGRIKSMIEGEEYCTYCTVFKFDPRDYPLVVRKLCNSLLLITGNNLSVYELVVLH